MEKKTNGMAIAAFVLGLCGFLTFGCTSMVGFILGLVALGQIKEKNEGGLGLAITAVVLGGLTILAGILYFIFVGAVAFAGA